MLDRAPRRGRFTNIKTHNSMWIAPLYGLSEVLSSGKNWVDLLYLLKKLGKLPKSRSRLAPL
jgi:hypothetical protein